MKRLILSIYLLQCLVTIFAKDLEILILHNNDMHARFEETSIRCSKCPQLGSNLCYGGFARVAHVVRTAREDAEKGRGPAVLYLNAGDTYTGTPWFVTHKWDIAIDFLNILKPDAASLGNHEFDEGIHGLIPLLEGKSFPIVTANINDIRLKGLEKSVILTVSGYKIGIVGYLTPQTVEISQAEDVNFTDEVEAINEESSKLKEKGIKTIFALGHSGFEMDKIIAKKCPLIDLVIGGHTNTFLWNGPKPSIEDSEGDYPTVIKQKGGKKVPVVQAYAYTKYMGRLYIKIDTETGGIKSFKGEPMLLNSSVPQEQDVLQVLDKYRQQVEALDHKIMGRTKVLLEGSDTVCRRRECNLGNLIADAFVDYRAKYYTGHFWTDAAIALVNSGSIRMPIDASKRNGDISHGDLAGTMPFNNDIVTVVLSGKELLDVLEFSVHGNGETSGGEFLQLSGIQAVFDRRNKIGKRLISAKARCASCSIPIYEEIDENKDYKFIIPSFLSIGGDGYKILKHARNKTVLSINDFDSVVSYIEKQRVVYPAEEGRIVMLGAGSTIIPNISYLFSFWILNLLYHLHT